MADKILQVHSLSHKYTTDWAIRNINFEIDGKGVLGLLGSNGAGKSTTMNIICNVLNPTEGDIIINGVDLRKYPIKAKENIGFLPQKAPLHTDLTVDEYLYHCAVIRGIAKKDIHNSILVAKEKCGISHFSKRLISNLSGGYQQRVGIAQSIIHNPKFVVLDEPTNGLDPNQILEVRYLIQTIAEERAVLISTHILPEVQAMCDNIIMIDNGNMVFHGTITDFNNYMEPSVVFAIMYNPPKDEDLMRIEGIERIERLTNIRMRIHFLGDETIIEKIIRQSLANNWQLKEIYLEKESIDKVFAKLSGKNKMM